MDLPPITDYDIAMSLREVQQICEERVTQVQKPCTVITIEGRVCYAYSELDGSTDSVHCFIRKDNGD